MTQAVAERQPYLALLRDLEEAGAISTIGLHLSNPDLSYNELEAVCNLLGKMHEAVRFAIGDAILLAEKLFKESAYQLIEVLNLSETARREYVRVSEKVPRSIRTEKLSWSHHRAVAALTPSEQKQWLATAAEQRLSHHALREALRNGHEPAERTCRCCHRPLDD